ncbi:VOC family protein [Devosia sp. SD17-2]|uniref:VOC family protein n=1 Tax=Devosia sp. SD17-2 TaxID=2976459 RepID=UPI0023D7C396|nr:VOC family protein [Devosia sp. SD17-2]WEJ31664.1 VOC family protein [Devosia sp. SD17-2]
MSLDAIEVITLFVPNLDEVRDFYQRIFAVEIVHQDDVSAVFGFAGTMINLLAEPQAPVLVDPMQIGSISDGPRMLLTILVDDVDAEYERLQSLGVRFLNGPINQPWGRRTAAFADPGGFAWEIAQFTPEK